MDTIVRAAGEDTRPRGAAADSSELLDRFVDDGFCFLPAVLNASSLVELTAAFRAAQEPVMAAWERSGAQNGMGLASRSFDLNEFEQPGSFLRDSTWLRCLLENPVVTSLAASVCGEGHQLVSNAVGGQRPCSYHTL
jgi:hypothetical protein|eukprot:COSAG06_NODE_148_length_22056_cov_75.881239_15_plen_137_part_00